MEAWVTRCYRASLYSCSISAIVGTRGLFCGDPDAKACAAMVGMTLK